MGLALARVDPPSTSLAGLCRLILIIIRHRIYKLEYLARSLELWLVALGSTQSQFLSVLNPQISNAFRRETSSGILCL